MGIALTRAVSAEIGNCELSYLSRRQIDVARARRQHHAYERTLETLGYEIPRLPAEPGLADSVFVEDTAVVLDELAVLARPGAATRRREVETVAAALRVHRRLERIEPPATLDGGDVLVVGRNVWIGCSRRTDTRGARQLSRLLRRLGYSVKEVPVDHCLHLKSAVTSLDRKTVLIRPDWIDAALFGEVDCIAIESSEPAAANVLAVSGVVLVPAAHPRTADRIASRGFDVRLVEADELAKAEGGLTCCSLFVEGGIP